MRTNLVEANADFSLFIPPMGRYFKMNIVCSTLQLEPLREVARAGGSA